MDDIIMNFLLIEGYKEPALNFSKESGITCILFNLVNQEDIDCMDERIAIRNLIF